MKGNSSLPEEIPSRALCVRRESHASAQEEEIFRKWQSSHNHKMANRKLNKKDKENLYCILDKAKNSELYWIRDQVDHEIELSESCIKDGEEKRR